jgi:hypothetical protein
MDENVYWTCFFGIVACVIITLIVAVTTCNLSEKAKIAEGIAKGGDPIAVSCAYDPLRDVCKVYIGKK